MYMNESSYNVKTHVFEGPLDTLLSLIEKRKLFINDISLAQVADDYITYVKSLEHFPIGDSAHFILIASTLVLIKSKSLLPNLALTQEEESNIEDLEKRLREYQRYKNLSTHLRERFGTQVSYLRQPTVEKMIVFSPDRNTTIESLRNTVAAIIAALPKLEQIPKTIVKKVISLEEMIESLSQRITTSLKMSFRDFAGMKGGLDKENKVTVIVGFLAMLELVKQGMIQVRQDQDFQDIEIEMHAVGVPRY